MSWKKVGDWLKSNAGTGAAVVGSLLTGNVPGAVAAGVAMVTKATGFAEPDAVLAALQQDPATVVRLREVAAQQEAAVNAHIEAMARIAAEDAAAEQQSTQETIRAGDNADDVVVRRTRPLMAWSGLAGAGVLATMMFWTETVIQFEHIYVLLVFAALPYTYMGMRGFDKFLDAWKSVKGEK